jgi:hypothetical protein
MYKLTFRTCCLLLSVFTITVAQADCVRHIYNNSNAVWKLQMTRHYTENEQSNTNIPCVGSCTLLPKQVIEIYYPNRSFLDGGATVGITDKNNRTRYFDISLPYIHCAKISHTGSTGSVSLNDPASGDIKIEKDIW